ncbi:MAG: type II toxin-antitoxin system HicB family antitoxin [Myxococcota bacterium]
MSGTLHREGQEGPSDYGEGGGSLSWQGLVTMTTYNVRYEIDEAGWWVASVSDVAGCHTQGRSLKTVRERIREALSVCVDDADDATLNEVYAIPNKAALSLTRRAKTAKQRAEVAQEQAQALLRDAVLQLTACKLSHRDMAVLLGLSQQRVTQLVKEARTRRTNRKRKEA